MRVLFLGLFILLQSLRAFAASDLHGEAWLSIIDRLQSQGVNSVGALKLEQLKKESTDIQWRSAKEVPSVLAGARSSAYYLTKTKEIFVAETFPEDIKSSVPDLELHEVLGALGYEDDKYTKSTALRILSEISPSQRKQLLKDLSKDLFHRDNLRIKEGGTSVSGGGDIRAIVIKNQVLREIMKTSRTMNPAFLKNFPLLNFEPLRAKNVDFVVIDYKFSGPLAIEKMGALPRISVKEGAQEIINFLIPIHVWEKGPHQRQALIKDLRDKVAGFFPPYLGDKSTMKISICNGRETAVIPRTADRNVYDVQKFRWGYLNGCDRMMEAEAGIVSPGLTEEERPKQAGKYYYDCGFTRGKQSFREQVVIAENTSTMALVDVMFENNQKLTGIPHFDGHGGMIQIILKLAKGEKSEFVARKKVTSEADQYISYKLNGKTIVFDCEKL